MNARGLFFPVHQISHLGFDVILITSAISSSNGWLCDGGNHARPLRLFVFPVNVHGNFEEQEKSDEAEGKSKYKRYEWP